MTQTIEPDEPAVENRPLFTRWDMRKLKRVFQTGEMPPVKVSYCTILTQLQIYQLCIYANPIHDRSMKYTL